MSDKVGGRAVQVGDTGGALSENGVGESCAGVVGSEVQGLEGWVASVVSFELGGEIEGGGGFSFGGCFRGSGKGESGGGEEGNGKG